MTAVVTHRHRVPGSTARATAASATAPCGGRRRTRGDVPDLGPLDVERRARQQATGPSTSRPRTGRGTLPPRLSMRATSSWPV